MTAWVPKPNFEVTEDSRPRKLTEAEIDDILENTPVPVTTRPGSRVRLGLPRIPGATNKARDVATANMKRKIKVMLSKIEISPPMIPELVRTIFKKYESSFATPGSAVGITAAEALGRQATQTVLNTFHVSGSAKNASYGLQGMGEMINATSSKNKKNPSCTIVFKDKTMNYLDVLRKRRDIVGITVGALVADWEIEPFEKLTQYKWHKIYQLVMGRRIPTTGFVLRLYLDVNMMFQYRVTMERICKVIEREDAECVHSPFPFVVTEIIEGEEVTRHKAIIDIFPKEGLIKESLVKKGISTLDRPALIFLNSVLRPALDKLVIQGIPNITGFFPNPVEVLKIIRAEVRTYPESSPEIQGANEGRRQELRRTWNIVFNTTQMKLSGLTAENLNRLLTVLSIKPLKWFPGHVTVELSEFTEIKFSGFKVEEVEKLLKAATIEVGEIRTDSVILTLKDKESPRDFIKRGISIAELIEAEKYTQNRRNGIFLPPLNDPIIQAARYYTADTNGTNLQELLSREDVDPEHTFSNDMHEITKVLGVDAAKTFYIYELNKIIINSEGYVEARHLMLIASFIFNQGRPLGLTFAGISRQPNSYLSLASFQRSVETFARASLYGRTDKMLDTSAAISVGKQINIGTGAIDIDLTPEYQKIYAEFLKKGTTIDPEVAEGAVRIFEQQAFGGEGYQYTGEYDESVNISEDLITLRRQVEESKQTEFSTMDRPVEAKPTTGKTPTMSEDLIKVLRMLSTAPAYPNIGTVQLRIGPLTSGLKEPATTGIIAPTVSILVPVVIPKLPKFKFVEPHVMPTIVEVLPVPMIFIRDEDI